MVRIINYCNPIQLLYGSSALKMTSTMCMKINILKTHLGVMLQRKPHFNRHLCYSHSQVIKLLALTRFITYNSSCSDSLKVVNIT
jgi:hypothetical protein